MTTSAHASQAPLAAALLAAICEHPDDMTPRLVLADHLEELGQGERAEFIRVQVELASIGWVTMPDGTRAVRTGCPEDDERERVLRRRAHDLLFDHWPRWLHAAFDGLSHDVGTSARDDNDFGVSLYDEGKNELGHFDCCFRRGFVEEVRLPRRVWEKHGAALVLASPVRSVRVSDREPYFFSYGWGWWRQTSNKPVTPRDTSDLPGAIFDLLEGGDPGPRGTRRPSRRLYPTSDDAHKALSAACVLLARKEARLP